MNPECRCPIWDYEHIVEYAVVQEHKEENLVLLCPTCNQARKGPHFTRKRIIKWLKEVSKQTEPERLFLDYPSIEFGSNLVHTSCMQSAYVFQIGRSYLHVEHVDEESRINAEFWNENGDLSLKIENSRYSFNTDVWDIDYNRGDIVKGTPGVLTFRNAPREISLQVEFGTNQRRIAIYGQFVLENGCRLSVEKNGIYTAGKLLARNCTVQGATLGFWVTDGTPLYSAIGPVYAIHNVMNVEDCSIVNVNIGFIWDITFLKDPKKHCTLGGLKRLVIKGAPFDLKE